MDGKTLKLSSGDHAIQAFPLTKGKAKLTSTDGAQTGVDLIHCYADGNFTITWDDATTTNIVCIAGDDYAIGKNKSLIIISGTFHIA